ncbi:MAG TPA: peptide MFS transporter [Flavobacteriaceae bacterium]|nr:peptide MFS transporter [Flavobacteriaceae bacterium]
MANSAVPRHQKQLFGHPVGLFVLFLTEMWERFSYYGMRAILVLYLVEQTTAANPGLGWTNGDAIMLYGWYTMLVYLTCIPGGIIADKLLGQKQTVLIGGILLTIGHGILAVEEMWAFYSGLVFIVLGVGMLKANISTMVGGLYKEGDIRRDKGFTIFYIGINTGALLSALIVGYVGENIGWHYGFGLAGIGMFLGLLTFYFGQRYLTNVGNKLSKEETQGASFGDLFRDLFKSPLQLTVSGILAAFSIYWAIFQHIGYGLLFLFLSLVVAMMLMVYKDLTSKIMKDRYVVILISFMMTIVFWGAFEQAGGLMNIYAKEKTDRMIEFLDFVVPATWFQSLNAAFIIIFGVFVANFWASRKLKGKEASSIFKMASGIIIMGLGFVFMAFASNEYQNSGASAMYWLVLAYLFHTIGELSSSPVALSFVTKLSPVKYASIMMGLYFAATGLGNKVAGIVGEISQGEPTKIEVTAAPNEIRPYLDPAEKTFEKGSDFKIKTELYPVDGEFMAVDAKTGKSVLNLIAFENQEHKKEITALLNENKVTKENPYTAMFQFNKDDDVKEAITNGKLNYSGIFIIDEVQSKLEFRTFVGITIFTAVFGLLIILLLKPLKRLTHGVEDTERVLPEQENYDLGEENFDKTPKMN